MFVTKSFLVEEILGTFTHFTWAALTSHHDVQLLFGAFQSFNGLFYAQASQSFAAHVDDLVVNFDTTVPAKLKEYSKVWFCFTSRPTLLELSIRFSSSTLLKKDHELRLDVQDRC